MLALTARSAAKARQFPLPAAARRQVAPLSSSAANPSSLLASNRRVEAQQQAASDELGDLMAKRWLGSAIATGTDADRVSPLLPADSE
jgi:hypothetical protein